MSLVYALLDKAEMIADVHLRAALAVWRYCEDSARYIWGDALGDPTADAILRALRTTTGGLTRSDIHNLFGRHKSVNEIDRALGVLTERGLVQLHKEETGGRPTTRFVCSS